MTKYKILKTFPGSPDGIRVITYTEGDEVEIPESLAIVALGEKWIKPATRQYTKKTDG